MPAGQEINSQISAFVRKGLQDQLSRGLPPEGLKPPNEPIKRRAKRLPPWGETTVFAPKEPPGLERIKEPDLPVTIISQRQLARTEKHRRILKSFALVDRQGFVYLPEWRSRRFVQSPQNYRLLSLPEDNLSRGAMVLPERQVSEVIFKRVTEREGSVEAAIDKTRDLVRESGRFLDRHRAIGESVIQAKQALSSLLKGESLTEDQYENLRAAYQRTADLLADCGVKSAWIEEVAGGSQKESLIRLLILAKSAESRWKEVGLISQRYTQVAEKLEEQRRQDWQVLSETVQELEKSLSDRSGGEKLGFARTQSHLLRFVKVRPYRHLAVSAAKELQKIQRRIEAGKDEEAQVMLNTLAERIFQTLKASGEIESSGKNE